MAACENGELVAQRMTQGGQIQVGERRALLDPLQVGAGEEVLHRHGPDHGARGACLRVYSRHRGRRAERERRTGDGGERRHAQSP